MIKALEAGREAVEEDVTAETSKDAEAGPADWQRRPRHRADSLAMMAQSFLAQCPAALSVGDRHQVMLIADSDVLSGAAETGECRLDEGPVIGVQKMRRLCCDASVSPVSLDRYGEPVNIGRKSRTIPPPMRRAMLLRDGGCRFPGCDRTRFIDGHHIEHWADGGETSLQNLVTLCRHHHWLVHEEGLTVRRTGANRFEFARPGESPRGNVIPDAATPPLKIGCPDLGVHIDKDTAACRWDGESMDYCEAVIALQYADGRLTH